MNSNNNDNDNEKGRNNDYHISLNYILNWMQSSVLFSFNFQVADADFLRSGPPRQTSPALDPTLCRRACRRLTRTG